MPEPLLDQRPIKRQKKEEKSSLKGTFVSVMTLGLFIIISWAGVWVLYLTR